MEIIDGPLPERTGHDGTVLSRDTWRYSMNRFRTATLVMLLLAALALWIGAATGQVRL